ncbi:PRC-barrel domain-containing protein [Brachybacterium sp.]|uniref:PRC-barrel domain-containing protein n=1 Tax=Brachybacterium sp. TaxID=1891286 RepID=UPI003F8FD402
MSPATRPDNSGDDARRRRLHALAGVTVHGSDGKTVGRVRDVYLHDATDELAAITVTPRQLSARSVLLPASAIAALPEVPEDPGPPRAEAKNPTADSPTAAAADDQATEQGGDHVLHLLVDAATAKAGVHPPATLHATPQGLQEAAAALHLEEGSAHV